MIMKYSKSVLAGLIIGLLFIQSVAAAKSPEGLWVATSPFFSDRPVAVIKIYINDKILYGELVKIVPLNENMKNAKIANSGPLMMYGYEENSGKWINGKIYEQITARIYKSSIEISKDGDHLYVRGFKGPFFRTARWDRIK